MEWISANKVSQYEGKEIKIRGWVYRKRETKGIVFIILRDSTDIVQCIVSEAVSYTHLTLPTKA